MKLPSLFLALSCLLLESDGFSLTRRHRRALTTPISLSQREDAESNVNQPHQLLSLVAVAVASALSFGALPTPSYAATAPGMAVSAPTMVLSEQIKTLDMSLPSYSEVADAKASVETVKSLAEDPPARNSASEGGGRGERKSSGAVSEKAAKKKEEALAKQKAREAFERENTKGKAVDVVDMSVPSYDQSTTQSQRSSFSL